MRPEKTGDAKGDDSLEETLARVSFSEPSRGLMLSKTGTESTVSGGRLKRTILAGVQFAAPSASRPTCTKCRRPWRWPRNAAHVNLVSNVPERIKPTTKSTVVAHLTAIPGSCPPQPTMCEAIFRRLELLHTPEGMFNLVRNRVTRQFLYHKVGGYVNYDVSKQDQSGYAFARLITLNSWYVALFKCLMVTIFNILDHYANFILVLQLFTDTDDPMVEDFGEAKWPFAIGWIVMLLMTLFLAGHSAWVEWHVKVGPRVGDLIPQCGTSDIVLTFAAMTCFAFFAVEQQVKDIVIVLHPWKSIQPYAAFKSDGVRAYAVGYLDEFLFKVENLPGFFALFAQMLMRTFVFVFKTYRLIVFFSPALVASVFSSVGSILFGWRAWVQLLLARRQLHAKLVSIVNEERDESEATEHWKRQRDAAKKLLTLHFSFRARQHAEDKGSRSFSPVVNEKPECPKCGRDLVQRATLLSELSEVEVGDQVQLSDNYLKFHDAKYGPLKPGDIGTVMEIGPNIPICGARRLVRTEVGGEPRTWWYDEGSVQKPPPTIPRSPSPEGFSDTPPASTDGAAAGGAPAATEEIDELSQELHGLLGRLLQQPADRRRAHATDLIRAAEVLARGDTDGADVLRMPTFDSGLLRRSLAAEGGGEPREEAIQGEHARERSLPGAVHEDAT